MSTSLKKKLNYKYKLRKFIVTFLINPTLRPTDEPEKFTKHIFMINSQQSCLMRMHWLLDC